MLKDKRELEQYLEKRILNFTSDTEFCNKIYNYANEKYDLPRSIASDYISLRNPLEEANEFILYCILDSIEHAREEKKSEIPSFYVEKEIKTYSKTKFKVDKIKFPIKLKALQISDEQWISSIDFKTLMKLRAAQLIVYNENTQRTMQRVIRDEKEFYKIDINKYAVKEIERLYTENTYIPTPLTFNIPVDSESDFYYDEENCELVIISLDGFDIVDGYHRYIAACKACDSNPNFNFTMELRIVNFPENKAQQFIYQEDQKTLMTKTDSNTYDQMSVSNRIVEKINTNPQSNLFGLISRNKGIISYKDFAEIISYLYLSDNKKKNANSVVSTVSKNLIENFNILTDYNTQYMEQKFTYKKLFATMVCFKYYENKNIDKENMCETIEEVIKRVELLDNETFYKNKSKKVVVTCIETIIEEVL